MGFILTLRRLLGLDSGSSQHPSGSEDLSHLINEEEVAAMPKEDGFERIHGFKKSKVRINAVTGDLIFDDNLIKNISGDFYTPTSPNLPDRELKLNPNYPQESLYTEVLSEKVAKYGSASMKEPEDLFEVASVVKEGDKTSTILTSGLIIESIDVPNPRKLKVKLESSEESVPRVAKKRKPRKKKTIKDNGEG